MDMSSFKPRTFITKAGRHVETRPHFATFNDKHNASKCKVLIVLYHRKYKLNDDTGLGVGELHRQSGVGYDYIKSRVTKWVDWQYLKRKVQERGTGRPVYVYSLDERGRHFIEDILPREWLQRYISEIQDFKNMTVKGIDIITISGHN